jgi:hypothetical protein
LSPVTLFVDGSVRRLEGAACRPAGLVLAAFCAVAGVHAQPLAAHDADGVRLQRLLQYELLLGVTLPVDTALCVDAALSGAWVLPGTARQELSPMVPERVRQAAETCEAARQPEDRRLAAKLRARAEQQLEAAAWAEERLPKARACLALSADISALRDCVTAALGTQPSEADWRRWTALFERRKR